MNTQRCYKNARAVVAALEPSYPVFCVAPGVLMHQAQAFLDAFPGRVLYAVKCNPHPRILKPLYAAGIRHFDTASLPEIAQIRELFPDATAYFMHPVKSRAVTRTAYEVYGVRHFAVDHPAEFDKIMKATGGDGVVMVVRLKTAESKALYHLASKFGASPDMAVELLQATRREGLQAGISFHVGSQCLATTAYADALTLASQVLDQSGVDLQFMDVGGGFPVAYPGHDAPALSAYVHTVKSGIERLRLRNDCVLVCEPGRALVANGCSLLVQVLLRKEEEIYINDGIYGSLSEMVAAKLELPVCLIRLQGDCAARMRLFKVYGPTCDSLDVLPARFLLPEDVREDDWIEIGQIGAYSNAAASRFNGFFADTFVEVEEGFRG